jgi:glycosyltransferase involved in cell wall biosynthesis
MLGRKSMDKLYIVIPAYNEQDNIESVAREWHEVVERIGGESRLVIIDDGSKDSTYNKLLELAGELKYLEPLTKPNQGHGPTCLYGYNYAIKKGADYIFQTDSDGQTLPSEFDEFWKDRKRYDMLIGYRHKRQDGLSRIFVTRVLRLVLLLTFRTWVKDSNTPYRLMKKETLEKYIGLIPKDFNLSNVIISVIYSKMKLAVKFIPITFRPRQKGVNSINFKKITKIGRKAFGDFIHINKVLKKAGKGSN